MIWEAEALSSAAEAFDKSELCVVTYLLSSLVGSAAWGEEDDTTLLSITSILLNCLLWAASTSSTLQRLSS